MLWYALPQYSRREFASASCNSATYWGKICLLKMRVVAWRARAVELVLGGCMCRKIDVRSVAGIVFFAGDICYHPLCLVWFCDAK